MKADEVVLRFLTSIGRPTEAALYLELFRSTRPQSFAIICVSESVMAQATGALVTDLRFLSRLGLTPVVVFGLFDADGAEASAQYASEVAAALGPSTTSAVVPAEQALATCETGAIPLVTAKSFEVLTQLAAELSPRKTIFLGRRSGLLPDGGPPPSLVDITTEYQALAVPGVLPAKQAALLARIRELLVGVPHPMTVAVTSPLDLLRELFTERGAGTLLRVGAEVARHDSISQVDRPRLESLINTAFDRHLAPDFFDRPLSAIYLTHQGPPSTRAEYSGAAVLESTEQGPYLSKFAVGLAARGEGTGRDLFSALAADHPRLYWRARTDNPIAIWYAQRADGLQRSDGWTIYWRGMPAQDIPAAITSALRAPIDLR